MSPATVVAFIVISASPGGLSPEARLELARVQTAKADYEECAKTLQGIDQLDAPDSLRATMHVQRGVCQYNLGVAALARAEFERALELDPNVHPPALTSPKIIEAFEQIARVVRKQSSATASANAKPPPGETAPTRAADAPVQPRLAPEQQPSAEAATATAPAPTGHVKVVPIVLGGVGVAGLAVGTVMGLQANQLQNEAHAKTFRSDAEPLVNQAEGRATIANVGFAVGVSAAISAVVTYFVLD